MSTQFTLSDIFGYTGTILCIGSFLFQIYQVFKTKSAKDISYGFILLQLSVNILFTIYNSINFSIPLLLNNGTLVILTIVMFIQKYYYDIYLKKVSTDAITKEEILEVVLNTTDNDIQANDQLEVETRETI